MCCATFFLPRLIGLMHYHDLSNSIPMYLHTYTTLHDTFRIDIIILKHFFLSLQPLFLFDNV